MIDAERVVELLVLFVAIALAIAYGREIWEVEHRECGDRGERGRRDGA